MSSLPNIADLQNLTDNIIAGVNLSSAECTMYFLLFQKVPSSILKMYAYAEEVVDLMQLLFQFR